MISRICGTLLEKQTQEVLVDVGGVGYALLVPMNTMFQLPDTGKEIVLHTHFVVREDAQQLYGFIDNQERTLFRILIRINGVGPKMALTILSGMEAAEFATCVQNNDINSLTKLPGVGKKTAERLLVEVRDKLVEWQPVNSETGAHGDETVSTAGSVQVKEAESALQSLGYKPADATKAVAIALKQLSNDEQEITSEVLIRVALRSMG